MITAAVKMIVAVVTMIIHIDNDDDENAVDENECELQLR